MAINFPVATSNGQTFVSSAGTYVWYSNYGVWRSSSGTSTSVVTTYDIDDISSYTDGYINTFIATYNQSAVSLNSPSNISVTVNGIDQRAFDYNTDTFWNSNVLFANKGYTVVTSNTAVGNNTIASGVIKFAESLPINSDIYIRYTGGTPNSTKKIYPFKPVDIVMGF